MSHARRQFLRLIALSAVALGSPTRATQERIVSRYSSTAQRKSLSFEEDRGEGGGGFCGLFAGFGGYTLEHLAGDERSWINVKFGNDTVDLYESTMRIGGGTFPHKANDVVEWRGVNKDGWFTPYALIYRLKAGNDETRKWHTRLIVIELDWERSAIVGYAEGPNEELKARQIADRARPR